VTSRTRRRLARAGLVVALLLFGLAAGGGLYVRHELVNSLAVLDGERQLDGLGAAVTVTRDELGIPTVTAASRLDAARALGFVHAQERFFQMDLQRRQAAGELAALFGARALPADRVARVHRFRHVARKALNHAVPKYRAILEAYTEGINAGLRALDRPPFEYLVLGQHPSPWAPEDSVLTLLAMFNTLQGRQAAFERTFGALYDKLPPALYAFLTARGSDWDAPVLGHGSVRPRIPEPEIFELRRLHVQATRLDDARGALSASRRAEAPRHREEKNAFLSSRIDPLGVSEPLWPVRVSPEEAAGIGSNNWVVDGRHTSTGAALVANDMHLALNVPNIWYRAAMRMPDPNLPTATLQLVGVTLPGLPSLVVGSNGYVAWGFTNSGGDWSDLVIVEADAREPAKYVSPDGARRFEELDEIIQVAGGASETVRVRWTIWGPVVGADLQGRPLAQRWVAHDPAIVARDITGLEDARSTTDALSRFSELGIPAQNAVVGDRDGRIGWTIAGPIPRRRGHDGSRPRWWADGTCGWDGYLSPEAYPRIVDPPSGRIWTANAPVVDGRMLETIGDGGYADGIRARMIRDRLMAIDRATAADMLAVQLEDGALFHERWRTLLLAVLTDAAIHANPLRIEFRRLLRSTWTGRATPESVAYRLVRTVRQVLVRDVFASITASVRAADADFDFSRALRSEGPLWQLVTERPGHLLDPRYTTWEDQLLAAIDDAIRELTSDNYLLAERPWGAFNRAQVLHPLSGALPLIGRWLNMPDDALGGDIYAPRAHSPRAGPSERIIVSPGREHEGFAHMPGGQSGHPLSPHYGDQHRAWVDGKPLPFLPGPARHTLTLLPPSRRAN
jgi:penicillin G amidase